MEKKSQKMEKTEVKNDAKVEKKVELNPQEIAENKVLELTKLVQQVQADFQNYKKRVDAEKKDLIKYSSKDIITKLIPILDNFQLALNNANPTKDFIKGVEMIYSQFLLTLEKEGLKPLNAENCQFDPTLHEAISHVHSEEKAGMVIEEYQQGYKLNDKIIRHSRVKVSAGPEKKKK